MNENRRRRVIYLENRLDGMGNDARLWDLKRTYGDYSREVLAHLEHCASVQAAGKNHT